MWVSWNQINVNMHTFSAEAKIQDLHTYTRMYELCLIH
jgi:hypothetical protein